MDWVQPRAGPKWHSGGVNDPAAVNLTQVILHGARQCDLRGDRRPRLTGPFIGVAMLGLCLGFERPATPNSVIRTGMMRCLLDAKSVSGVSIGAISIVPDWASELEIVGWVQAIAETHHTLQTRR